MFLKRVQEMFATLGISSSLPRNNRKLALTCLIFGMSLISCAVFLVLKVSTFKEYTLSVCVTSTLTIMTICFVVVIFKKVKFFRLIDKTEDLFQQRAGNSSSNESYEDICGFIEKWTGIGCFVIGEVTPVCLLFPIATMSYFNYFTSNLESDAFVLPMPFWFPFDWKNPFAYSIAVILQYIWARRFLVFDACTLMNGIGNFIFSISMTNELKNDLKSINKMAKTKSKRLKISESLSNFTQFYSSLKQLIYDFKDIYQPIFMVVSAWSLITICGVMLLIQMELQEPDPVLVCVIMFFGSYAFGVQFAISELCQRLTDAFEKISDQISAFEWNLFPLEIQKLLPMVLIGVQRPVEIECFGSIAASRDTFKKVIKGGFNYFMVMRKFIMK